PAYVVGPRGRMELGGARAARWLAVRGYRAARWLAVRGYRAGSEVWVGQRADIPVEGGDLNARRVEDGKQIRADGPDRPRLHLATTAVVRQLRQRRPHGLCGIDDRLCGVDDGLCGIDDRLC